MPVRAIRVEYHGFTPAAINPVKLGSAPVVQWARSQHQCARSPRLTSFFLPFLKDFERAPMWGRRSILILARYLNLFELAASNETFAAEQESIVSA